MKDHFIFMKSHSIEIPDRILLLLGRQASNWSFNVKRWNYYSMAFHENNSISIMHVVV